MNGVSRATATGLSGNFGNATDTFNIGGRAGSKPLGGYLDEIRVSNNARYTSNFTPSTTAFTNDSNTKLLIHSNTTHASTTFTDSSSSTHTVTRQGSLIKHIAR